MFRKLSVVVICLVSLGGAALAQDAKPSLPMRKKRWAM